MVGAGQVRHEPIESIEVVQQSLLDIVLSMAEDAKRATIAAVSNCPQYSQIEIVRPQWQDLQPLQITFGNHAVEVNGIEMRQHFAQQIREAVEVIVAVVEVVDKSDIGQLESVDDG